MYTEIISLVHRRMGEYIDGTNADLFLQHVGPIVNGATGPRNDMRDQVLWMKSYWLNQITAIKTPILTIDDIRAIDSANDIGSFDAVFCQVILPVIDQFGLPRFNTGLPTINHNAA